MSTDEEIRWGQAAMVLADQLIEQHDCLCAIVAHGCPSQAFVHACKVPAAAFTALRRAGFLPSHECGLAEKHKLGPSCWRWNHGFISQLPEPGMVCMLNGFSPRKDGDYRSEVRARVVRANLLFSALVLQPLHSNDVADGPTIEAHLAPTGAYFIPKNTNMRGYLLLHMNAPPARTAR